MGKEARKRNTILRMRFTAEEMERLSKRAAEKGLGKSDYIRFKLGWKTLRKPQFRPKRLAQDVMDIAANSDAADSPLGGLAERLRKQEVNGTKAS